MCAPVDTPSKRLDAYLILLVVSGLVGPSIATALNLIGPIALAFIWAGVIIAALVAYAFSLRSRIAKLESGGSAPEVKQLSDEVASLRRENAKLRGDAEIRKATPSQLLNTRLSCGLKEFKYAMHRLQKSAVVEVHCEPSFPTEGYSFYLFDEDNLGRFRSGGRWEAEAFQENCRGDHDAKVRIPYAAKWFFTVAPPFKVSELYGEAEEADVRITVYLLEEGEPDDLSAAAARLDRPIPPNNIDQLRAQLKQTSRLRKFKPPLQGKESTQFVHWRTKTSELLWQAVPPDSVHAENFDDIEFEPKGLFGLPIPIGDPTDAFARGLDEAEAILKTVIEVLLAPENGGEKGA